MVTRPFPTTPVDSTPGPNSAVPRDFELAAFVCQSTVGVNMYYSDRLSSRFGSRHWFSYVLDVTLPEKQQGRTCVFSYIPHRFGFQLHAGGGAATRIRGAGRGCRARKGEQKEHFECRGDSTVLEGQISNAIRHRDCARAASHQNASAFPSQTPDGPAL